MNSTDIAIYQAVVKSHTGSHHDISRVIHLIYSDKWTCKYNKNGTIWFTRASQDDEWRERPDIHIRHQISTDVVRYYHKIAKTLYNKAFSETGHDILKPQYIDVATKLVHVCTKLKNTTFKNALMKELQEMFSHS